MQASLIYPHYRQGDFPPRGVPVRFVECPAVKKPGKRGTEEQLQAYRQAVKTQNLSRQGLEVMKGLRARLDAMGKSRRTMLAALDGSLCNQTIFKADFERVGLVARCRKDARLCLPAPEGGRRKYAEEKFRPEEVRQDESIPWKTTKVYFGGRRRKIRYKEVKNVLWQRGAGKKRLRLFVLAPQPYKMSPHSRMLYRQPAYLLATAKGAGAKTLIQAYLDRSQIEVNHREEKDSLGVGQAQVRSAKSVPRQPAFAVAAYSMLLLAAIQEFGPGRAEAFVPLPKWRKHAKRPSALDLITLLRQEINETQISGGLRQKIAQNITSYAYT